MCCVSAMFRFRATRVHSEFLHHTAVAKIANLGESFCIILIQRPSKGGSLVALSHPFVYRLTNGGNCRCRFSVQIHMSLWLQEFVSDVSLQ